MFSEVLLWEFKTLPNPHEVVVDVTEDTHLPMCISAQAFELVQAGGE